MLALYIILGVLALFLLIVALRTAFFRPKAQPPVSEEEVTFNYDKAVNALAELVKCKTISYNDHSLEDDEEFRKLEDPGRIYEKEPRQIQAGSDIELL